MNQIEGRMLSHEKISFHACCTFGSLLAAVLVRQKDEMQRSGCFRWQERDRSRGRLLDNNQSAHDALDRLDELKEKMEYVDSEDASKPTHSADYSVSSDLVLLSHEITFDSIDHDRYDKILEKRNDIAKTIGE